MELELHQDKAEYVINAWFTDKLIEKKLLKADKVRDTIEDSVESMPSWSLLTALGHKPKEQSVERIEKWVLESILPSLAVLKKTGHW
ncbi:MULTISPECIES: hypothetical protein [Leuconostoc gelidum group]|uniref:hypothetical protein n=1 Tax=Leuconostoc gelidum group TaxID=3016637 RepID=UPI000497FA74|nr:MULTISPECIES: hypothetical protein [Leuconostoc gelidum group]GMA68238.1 hypothetical protein GCM10025884_18650 [Leuconostoc gelidum subsp. gelidum]